MTPKIEAGQVWIDGTGREVRIIATDLKSPFPIVGVAKDERKEFAEAYTADGRWSAGGPHANDLVSLAPEKNVYERWVNVYGDGLTTTHQTRQHADLGKAPPRGGSRIACLHIWHEYAKGEGLE